jgi:hypothetical protein
MVEKIKAIKKQYHTIAPETWHRDMMGAIAAALAEAEKVDADIKHLRQALAVVMKPDTARSSEYAAASLRVLLFFERYDPASNSTTEQTTNDKEPK